MLEQLEVVKAYKSTSNVMDHYQIVYTAKPGSHC